jgi:hypothetical protein
VTPRLADVLASAADDSRPEPDGRVDVLPRPAGATAAIVAFTAHHVVAADVPAAWVARRCPTWVLDAPFGPSFVASLGRRLGAAPGSLDVVLVADGANTPRPRRDLVPDPATGPALIDAPNPRKDLRAWRTTDGAGRLILGRGLEGRWELAFEVEHGARGRGLGRGLAAAARAIVGPGERVYAQIAPGNVASLRAVLAVGFRPLAAEILFWPRSSPDATAGRPRSRGGGTPASGPRAAR